MIQTVKGIVTDISTKIDANNTLSVELYYKGSDRMTALEFELTSQLSSITKRLDKIESLLYELGVDK
jgi:hypothetical protein